MDAAVNAGRIQQLFFVISFWLYGGHLDPKGAVVNFALRALTLRQMAIGSADSAIEITRQSSSQLPSTR